ncbi:hypothetical protein K474DRAFT_275424 [Panus rudis PR-1116 ss-1]|nr:hypothetical protein K474DRAFT_275424 [Panus rudis PR-1116 ss-1]
MCVGQRRKWITRIVGDRGYDRSESGRASRRQNCDIRSIFLFSRSVQTRQFVELMGEACAIYTRIFSLELSHPSSLGPIAVWISVLHNSTSANMAPKVTQEILVILLNRIILFRQRRGSDFMCPAISPSQYPR